MDLSVKSRYTGNRMQTIVENFVFYCDEHQLNVNLTRKLFEKEFGTTCFVEDNSLIIRGHFDINDINKVLGLNYVNNDG
jgi:translation initiation factor 2 beta subunit (eIF-2beta)/eIF-5